MRQLLLLFVLILVGCNNYQWGTVIGLSPDTDAMGCFGDLPKATIQLDDGRVMVRCMEVPIGTRVHVCYGEMCTLTVPDPEETP